MSIQLEMNHAEAMTTLAAFSELEAKLYTFFARTGQMPPQYTRIQAMQIRLRRAVAAAQDDLEQRHESIPLRERLANHPADLTPAA